uniref:Beta-fructofuranosidase/levanase/fructan beta-fructosidase n=1 Tax=Candidatus Kentrum sp. DK TaxID=2126562 RepID=A0A450T3S3_9GAMM|nr:MAG: beta-fructofuranosidase/levanase/fructan beta-fructosidase [Candidatus Kentron sp. DK]
MRRVGGFYYLPMRGDSKILANATTAEKDRSNPMQNSVRYPFAVPETGPDCSPTTPATGNRQFPHRFPAGRHIPGFYRLRVYAFLLILLSPLLLAAAESAYNEPYRPQFHFTPEKNWMNDPNGPVYLAGEYHLFYQYDPLGSEPDHIGWGHAISEDLVHWRHLSPAIPEKQGIMTFSGSTVVDARNTSGFGDSGTTHSGEGPLVAIHTGYREADGRQAQYLAYSLDRGRTWTRYPGNPVLDIDSKDFRDPKVFWYESDKRWIMVVALAAERRISFYSSPDLTQWEHRSDFGPAGAIGGAWECPDLFPLAVAGSPGLVRWVLEVGLDRRAISGGSGEQYFIGGFDGRRFLPDRPPEPASPPPKGRLLADFDRAFPPGWEREGNAFRIAPVDSVTGGIGPGVLHSGLAGDGATGSLTSAAFPLEKDYLSFLIGGGRNSEKLTVALIVDGKTVRRTSGYNGDVLDWISWDMRPFRGQSAMLRIADQDTGEYWGHLVVDNVVLSDTPARPSVHRGRWVDYGPDFYAATSWSGIPATDGRRLSIAWMNNWLYGRKIPTSPWRGAMTVPRVLGLRAGEDGALRLVQAPIQELQGLRGEAFETGPLTVSEGEKILKPIRGNRLELEATFQLLPHATPEKFGLIVHQADNQGTVIGYDTHQGEIFLDRRGAGKEDFDPSFPARVRGPLPVSDGRITLHLFVDRSSVEVFGNDGRTVLTARVFPGAENQGVALFARGGEARLAALKAWKLRSIW